MRTPGPPFVDVEKIYGSRGPLQQYRLRSPLTFRCLRCGSVKTSKLVTTYGDDPTRRLCNGCYGRLLSLYNIKSGTLPDGDRDAALTDVLLSLVPADEAQAAARRAKFAADSIRYLDPLAVRFLGTAVYVADALVDVDLDWSAAILGLCKALEVELVRRLIDPLKSGMDRRDSVDRQDRDLKRLTVYLADSEGRRPPELGAIAHFLTLATSSHHRAASSPLIYAFRSYVARMPGHLWISMGSASQAVSRVAREYRNPAAHTSTLTRLDYESCREAVVGEDGALWKLVDATETR